ncbi:MAG: GNAT family N-acetyltransferase [Thermoplasmata archaeon]|nr:GNAT family N-acetyltransferase [Thermoplasmata archaeon]
MTLSDMKIRPAKNDDIDAVIRITRANGHFWTPEVDGSEALARILERDNNLFLVYDDGKVQGFVLGTWDGARAYIHKISVHPDIKTKGIGTLLVAHAIEFFRNIGAPTVAVAAADGTRDEEEDSTGFWKKVGFEPIPARLMIHFDVQKEIEP